MAIAEHPLLAEMALAAGNVERDEDMVADLQVLHLRPDLLDDAGELVAERLPDPSVRYHAVVKVEVRAADAASGDPHHRVTWMLDGRHRLFVDANAVRSAIIHGAHEG